MARPTCWAGKPSRPAATASTRYDQVALLLSAGGKGNDAAEALLRGDAHQSWIEVRKLAQSMVDDNNAVNERAAHGINAAVSSAKVGIEVALLAAVAVGLVCGYLLLRAITVPMRSIVGLLAGIRGGDLRLRMGHSGAATNSRPSRKASTR